MGFTWILGPRKYVKYVQVGTCFSSFGPLLFCVCLCLSVCVCVCFFFFFVCVCVCVFLCVCGGSICRRGITIRLGLWPKPYGSCCPLRELRCCCKACCRCCQRIWKTGKVFKARLASVSLFPHTCTPQSRSFPRRPGGSSRWHPQLWLPILDLIRLW